jgi:hypothetical protein
MIEAVSSGHSPVEGWLDLARIVLCSVTITWLDNPLRYGDGQQFREQHQNTKDDHQGWHFGIDTDSPSLT